MYMQYEKYVYKDTIKLIKPIVKLFYFDLTSHNKPRIMSVEILKLLFLALMLKRCDT